MPSFQLKKTTVIEAQRLKEQFFISSSGMEQLSPVVKSFLAGSFSGICSTILFQPLDLIKTRIQLAVNIRPGQSSRMITVLQNVVQQEKVRGLWKGTAPSVLRCVPGIGVYFSSIHILQGRFGHTSPVVSLVIGGTARSMACLTTLPFTVLKTRYESGQFKYKNMGRGFITIFKSEGIRGLYSGLSPTLLRDVPFSGLYYMFYSQLKEITRKGSAVESHYPRSLHFTCGVAAGIIASLITQPADVIKTHMQLYPKRFGRIMKAIHYVYQEDGLAGFWRGIVPRALRRTLMATMAWTIYEEIIKSCGLKK
ncbi:hypothetical protein CHS0354_039456 [Potamilus streckersoni]|uniref:Mitochondrial glycine transporter n=1 Tax=Potamilus streckersoni TaxID=2493646 RepID=A0AAE0S281_9BIVA|nr:hypothetical protein CHS0354_039456 [Potamilus streckersoni]